jgi:hypothetical protein
VQFNCSNEGVTTEETADTLVAAIGFEGRDPPLHTRYSSEQRVLFNGDEQILVISEKVFCDSKQ